MILNIKYFEFVILQIFKIFYFLNLDIYKYYNKSIIITLRKNY